MPRDTLPPPGGGDPPNDSLALALSECPRCLGAYLYALAHPSLWIDCPAATEDPPCSARWRFDPPSVPAPVDVVGDLEVLALWLPTIGGRAVNYDAQRGGSPRHGERSDAIDERHRRLHDGLRRALASLGHLDQLERAGQHQHVKVLWYAYVLCGPELARTHHGGLADLVGWKFAEPDQVKRWKSARNRVVKAVGPELHGQKLLDGAHAAYVAAVRGHLRVPPRAAAPVALSERLDHLLARTLDQPTGDRS